MHILIIDNSTAFTGALKAAMSEAQLLQGKHQFSFLLPTGSTAVDTVKAAGFTVHQLPMKEISKSIAALLKYPSYLIANAFKLQKILKAERIDCIQTNDFYNLLGATSKMLGYKGKLLTYVRFLPSVMPGPLRKFWTATAQRYADRVIAVSHAVLKQLPSSSKTISIYDPVNLQEKHSNAAPPKDGLVYCLFLGNYTRGKGQDAAVEAFAKAYQQDNRLRLQFHGGDMGLEKNRAFKAELKQRAVALGLSDVINFGGFAADVELAIKQSHIVLNFSEGESFSMTCLEAAFYGTPLIATKCGGPEEIIDHERTGLLVPVKGINEMSETILAFAGNEDLRLRYAAAGKEYVSQKFSAAQYQQTMNNLLMQL